MPETPTESGHAYERTVNITPNAAIASFGVENWSDNSNAIGNWITISPSVSNPSAWNIRVLPNETGQSRSTILTATHPTDSSVIDTLNVDQQAS
tara:strand:- start:4695 stop:4976 length:282 start_codon:yes stop_codon:yes gene_type:complete